MIIDLTGRVVIMTGGSRGLGKAMALGLLEAGACVALASQDAARLAAATAEARQRHGKDRVIGVTCDVRDRDACLHLLDETLQAFGAVHVLVNNAALGQRYVHESPDSVSTKFWEADPARWRDAVDVNITGAFFLAHAVTPHLIRQGWGRIVNITTSLGTLQRKENSPYGVTKSAMEAATLIWAQELAGTGVTVNSLLPGRAANTDMVFAATGDLLPPEIMVPPIRWLASPLSDGVTGARFLAKDWDDSLPPAEAAKAAREAPVLREPPPDRRR